MSVLAWLPAPVHRAVRTHRHHPEWLAMAACAAAWVVLLPDLASLTAWTGSGAVVVHAGHAAHTGAVSILAGHASTSAAGPDGLAETATISVAVSVAMSVVMSAVMGVAMMTPLVLRQLSELATSSLWRRRHRALVGFLAGFWSVWTVAGLVLGFLAARLVAAVGTVPAVLVAFGIAAAVAVLPGRERLVRQCSARPVLAIRGWRADRDCLAYGVRTAGRCVSTCWALMLAVSTGHSVLVMAGATAIAVLERRARSGLGAARTVTWTISLGLLALALSR